MTENGKARCRRVIQATSGIALKVFTVAPVTEGVVLTTTVDFVIDIVVFIDTISPGIGGVAFITSVALVIDIVVMITLVLLHGLWPRELDCLSHELHLGDIDAFPTFCSCGRSIVSLHIRNIDHRVLVLRLQTLVPRTHLEKNLFPLEKNPSVHDTQKKNFCVQLVRPPVFHQGGLG